MKCETENCHRQAEFEVGYNVSAPLEEWHEDPLCGPCQDSFVKGSGVTDVQVTPI